MDNERVQQCHRCEQVHITVRNITTQSVGELRAQALPFFVFSWKNVQIQVNNLLSLKSMRWRSIRLKAWSWVSKSTELINVLRKQIVQMIYCLPFILDDCISSRFSGHVPTPYFLRAIGGGSTPFMYRYSWLGLLTEI